MQKNDVLAGSKDSRSKVPLRQRYLLEKERIRQEFGDLEQIRLTLGLSQRKVCQLLLVDPSAWTRWNKTGAPPHIYQALRWLIELRKTNPEVAPLPGNLDRRVDTLQSVTQNKLKELESNLAALERSVGFAPALTPQSAGPSADVTFELERALRAQEMKFQLEIAQLKARIDEILAAQQTKATKTKTAAPTRRAKPSKKKAIQKSRGKKKPATRKLARTTRKPAKKTLKTKSTKAVSAKKRSKIAKKSRALPSKRALPAHRKLRRMARPSR